MSDLITRATGAIVATCGIFMINTGNIIGYSMLGVGLFWLSIKGGE